MCMVQPTLSCLLLVLGDEAKGYQDYQILTIEKIASNEHRTQNL